MSAADLRVVRGGNRPRRSSRARASAAFLFALTLSTVGFVPSTAVARRHLRHAHYRRHHARTASGCAGAGAHVGSASTQVLRSAVVCLINQERTLHHLPALQASPLLDNSAQGWTNAMVSTDQFTHGANFSGRISATGYVWRSAGENIATGYATPRAVVRAWMASTGHCQNILNPSYRNVGTGVSARVVKGYATGAGTWTQDFALGMHQPTPSGNTGPMHGCPY